MFLVSVCSAGVNRHERLTLLGKVKKLIRYLDAGNLTGLTQVKRYFEGRQDLSTDELVDLCEDYFSLLKKKFSNE